MSAVMLRLPLTSVLLATLLPEADGLTVMPLIIAVVVAHVVTAHLTPATAGGRHPTTRRPSRQPKAVATVEPSPPIEELT